MEVTGTRFTATRKPIERALDYEGNRSHGLYSTKVKVPKLMGMDGKEVHPNCTIAPWLDPASNKLQRDALKGKQMATRRYPYPPRISDRYGQSDYFGPVTYAPDHYDPKAKRDDTRKMGFGTGRPLNRDDLSSVLEVGRFRHHLETERKQEKALVENIKAEAAALRAAAAARPPTAPTSGLSTKLPRFSHAFDRQFYVQEFSTKDTPKAERGEKHFGALRPTSADFGEGAWNKNILKEPEFAVKGATKTFNSQYARPSATIKFLNPIGL